MKEPIILGFAAISACLPSLATVRLQRIEQDEKQRSLLLLSGSIAFITIIGALEFEPLMWLGVLGMVALYLWLLFAPLEEVK